MTDPAKVRRHAERVRELVASVVRTQIKDPRLGMITITDSRITADLREATVFYTVLGDAAEQAATAAALESAKGLLRSTVGKALGLRALADARRSSTTTCRTRQAHRRPARRGPAAPTPRCSGWPPGARTPATPSRTSVDDEDRGRGRRPTRRPRRDDAVTARPVTARSTRRPQADATETGPRRSRRSRGAAAGRPGAAGLPRQPGRRRAGQHARLRRSGLRQLGFTDVQATFPGPFDVPEPFGFLPGLDLLVPGEQAVTRRRTWWSASTRPASRGSASWPDRLDAGAGRHGARPPRLQHRLRHGPPGRPGRRRDRRWSPRELLDRLGVPLDAEIADVPLRRRWPPTPARSSSTRPPRRCTSWRPGWWPTGIRPGEISRRVFDTRPVRRGPAASARCSAGPSWTRPRPAGAAWSWTYATLDDLRRHGQPAVRAGELHGLGPLRRRGGRRLPGEAGRPRASGRCRCAARARSTSAAVAVALGGGGHRLAAGFTGHGTVDEVLAAGPRPQLDDRRDPR